MAIHSSIRAWKIPWTEKPGSLQFMGSQSQTQLSDFHFHFLVSLMAQMVKNLSAMQETQVQFLSQEDPLEEGMTTHSSIVAWRIPWTEKPGGLQSMGITKSQTRLSD